MPVDQRCVFKVLTLVHKVIYSGSPDYLCVKKRSSVRATRSATAMTLDQPVSRLKSAGDRAFSVSAPALWNALPTSLTSEENYIAFKRNLKTHLFRQHYFNWFTCIGLDIYFISNWPIILWCFYVVIYNSCTAPLTIYFKAALYKCVIMIIILVLHVY